MKSFYQLKLFINYAFSHTNTLEEVVEEKQLLLIDIKVGLYNHFWDYKDRGTFTCILRTCLYLFSVLTCKSWCFISGCFQSIHLCSQIHGRVSPLCFHQISVNEQDKWLVFYSRFEHYPYQPYWCKCYRLICNRWPDLKPSGRFQSCPCQRMYMLVRSLA